MHRLLLAAAAAALFAAPNSVVGIATSPPLLSGSGGVRRGGAVGWRRTGAGAAAGALLHGAAAAAAGAGGRTAAGKGGNCPVGLRGGGDEVYGTGEAVLVLDVDGTLYSGGNAIEQQIIQGIHRFALARYTVDKEECERLHHKHGSTLEGLKIEHGMDEKSERAYYREVFAAVEYDALLSPPETEGDPTGYRHPALLRQILANPPCKVVVASNSPPHHVARVLTALGLAPLLATAEILTPQSQGGLTKADPAFWDSLLARFPPSEGHEVTLIDDSDVNLAVAESLGMRGIQVDESFPAAHAVLAQQGVIPFPEEWRFDAVKYLRAKNKVDAASMSKTVSASLAASLPQGAPLKVVDVGAGLLSMLPKIMALSPPRLDYYALEPEKSLFAENVKTLEEMGFVKLPDSTDRFFHEASSTTVVLLQEDFRALPPAVFGKVDLFVGCCFCDLVPPAAIVRGLMRLGGDQSGALLYAPITFCGKTTLSPALPREGRVPADEEVMNLYHKSLSRDQGHFLDPSRLISEVRAYGGALLSQGGSNWVIPAPPGENEKEDGGRLWETMHYFFATGTAGAAARAEEEGRGDWDMAGWTARARANLGTIEAHNVDLLFRLPSAPPPLQAAGMEGTSEHMENVEGEAAAAPGARQDEVLEFTATRKCSVRPPTEAEETLGENDIRLRTLASAVSPGTELKIFRGDFATDQPLDTTIESMQDTPMRYPLTYGYSLVGRVEEVGPGLDATEWLGRTVFAFAPHSSSPVVSADSVFIVPSGIAPEDACYFPAVETALSLVQEAHPVVGEKVAVFGQGVIGLLVTAILARSFGAHSVLAVEPNAERAALSRRMGAGAVAAPESLSGADAPTIDVSVEVSGSARALQSCLDTTAKGGRVILGSWYGENAAPLRLGLAFHRSHLSIRCSQVSEIPAELSGRWDKARRFEEAWAWVRRLRPSRTLSTKVVPLREAQAAYDLLDQGATVGVHFSY